MKTAWILTVATLWLVCCPSDARSAEVPPTGQLYYGWAAQSITPDRPVAIGGQYHTRISGEVHDPLTATALAIEVRNDQQVIDQAVLVSCDLCLIREQTQQRVRELVSGRVPDLDARKIFISTTHTHTAPALTDERETDLHPYDFIGSWAYRIPADREDVMRPAQYLSFLEQQIAEAVVEAWRGRQSGGVSFALSHASIAHNRRAVYFDGTARMYGDTADPGFSHIEGTSDHSVDVLFFWRGAGELSGLVINVYCPAQEVEGEQYLSADYWYDARRLLREAYGADLHVLPLTGAAGDQSPHLMWNKSAETAMRQRRNLANREEIARRIARAVDDVVQQARESVLTELPFEHRVVRVALPVWQVSEDRYAQARAVYEEGKEKLAELASPDYINWRVSRTMVARYQYQQQDPLHAVELHLLRLGDLAMATNPFELYVDYGVQIKARSPAAQTCVVQLTAGCAAYLATERAVRGGGYSARIDDGVIGPEGGKVLVDETSRILQEMFSP